MLELPRWGSPFANGRAVMEGEALPVEISSSHLQRLHVIGSKRVNCKINNK